MLQTEKESREPSEILLDRLVFCTTPCSVNLQRGANDLHAVVCKRLLNFFWCGQARMLCGIQNEGLELPNRRYECEQRARFVANMSPAMRDIARSKEGITGLEPKLLATNLKSELPLDHVEPLILLVMHMARRATLVNVVVLEHQHLPVGVFARKLDR